MAQASFKTVVTRLRDAFLATDPQDEEGRLVRELGALSLGTVDELWFFLHPDGRLLAFNLFFDEVTAEFTEMRDLAYGLRVGSLQYPELEGLMPERPTGALDCQRCAGIGRGRKSDGSRYACGWCHGRGWTEPTEAEPRAAADGGA